MEYKEFVYAVEERLSMKLGEGVHVHRYSTVKNNGKERQGVMIESSSSNISPTIYLEEFFDKIQKGRSFEQVISDISKLYENIKIPKMCDMSYLSNYEKVRGKIVFKLINTEKNQELLQEIPHVTLLDLSIVFYVLLEFNDKGTATILVQNHNMEEWAVDIQTLYSDAKENGVKLLPARLLSMQQVVREVFDKKNTQEKDLLHENVTEELHDCMYILTNSVRNLGAAVFAYPHILEMVGDVLGEDFYLLPSSIHEVIIVPKTQCLKPEELNEMVQEVNATQVLPEEVLADHAYFYERQSKKLIIEQYLG